MRLEAPLLQHIATPRLDSRARISGLAPKVPPLGSTSAGHHVPGTTIHESVPAREPREVHVAEMDAPQPTSGQTDNVRGLITSPSCRILPLFDPVGLNEAKLAILLLHKNLQGLLYIHDPVNTLPEIMSKTHGSDEAMHPAVRSMGTVCRTSGIKWLLVLMWWCPDSTTFPDRPLPTSQSKQHPAHAPRRPHPSVLPTPHLAPWARRGGTGRGVVGIGGAGAGEACSSGLGVG